MITAMPRIAIAVNDLPETIATFRDKLGMPVVDIPESSVKSLGASLAMCIPEGGSNIKLMSPADPAAPLSQSLQKFLDRRGEGLFALMLEAEDPNAEADEMSARGLDVLPLMAGAGGRDVHPRSTHGVLIRVYPNGSFQGQSDDTPQGPELSGIARVIVAVHDAAEAAAVYGRGFAMEVSAPLLDEDRGVLQAMCTPPAGGQIEFVSVVDRGRPFAHRIESFLDEHPEGMYALVLRAEDANAAADYLDAQGMDVARSDLIETSVSGARIHLEGR